MSTKSSAILACLLFQLTALAAAHAQSPQTPPPALDPAASAIPAIGCTRTGAASQIASCAAEQLKIADMQLSAAYTAALATIDRAAHLNTNQRRDWKRAFQEAHRHWLAFRDKDCGQLVGWEWFRGTGMATASLACKAHKTRARLDEIKTRYTASSG